MRPPVKIALSPLDKSAPKDVTIMYRLSHPAEGRRPGRVIADYDTIEAAQQHADLLTRGRVAFVFLTWWRRNGAHVKKWATLLSGKSRHFKLSVPYVDGINDDAIKVLVQNAILHGPGMPKQYDETSVKLRVDADANRMEVSDEVVQVRLPAVVAEMFRKLTPVEATALVEKAITGDNGEPAAEVVELNVTGPNPGKHINPLRELPVGTKLYTG